MPFSLKRRSNAFAGEAADKSVDGERKSKRKSLLRLLKGVRWRKKKDRAEEVGYPCLK
jgi:hypothetical protein